MKIIYFAFKPRVHHNVRFLSFIESGKDNTKFVSWYMENRKNGYDRHHLFSDRICLLESKSGWITFVSEKKKQC